MSLLRLNLKAQGVAVLRFFVFSSCDKILPPSGSGVDIPVKIRVVSIAGGAEKQLGKDGGGGGRKSASPLPD
jgi:hypothetical protein